MNKIYKNFDYYNIIYFLARLSEGGFNLTLVNTEIIRLIHNIISQAIRKRSLV